MFPKRVYYHYKDDYFEAYKDNNGIVILDRVKDKYFYLKETPTEFRIEWNRIEYRKLNIIIYAIIGTIFFSLLLPMHLAYRSDFSYINFRYAPKFVIYFALYSIAQVIIHELSHIVALKINGYEYDKFGFTLDYKILPSFYVRVNKIQLLPSDRKLIVHLSGVFTNAVINGIATCVCLQIDPPLFISSIFIIYSFGIVINSLPFINSDGFKSMLVVLDVKEFRYKKSTVVTVTKYLSILCIIIYVLFVVAISIIRYV